MLPAMLAMENHNNGKMNMFTATTHGVTITVMPVYIDERSKPEENAYFWAYRVSIENNAVETLQLLSRYWKITDSLGRVEEVEGSGVVGEQPVLSPGATYAYTSGCPLTTPSGIMVGHYVMKRRDGHTLRVDIPAFPLDLPDLDPVIN